MPPIAATLRLKPRQLVSSPEDLGECVPMAGLNKKSDIGIHEGSSHRNVLAVGEDSGLISTAPLDEAEDVIPTVKEISAPHSAAQPRCYSPTAVQSRRVCAELKQDLLHLERGRQGLNEHRSADGAMWHADI